MFLKTKIRNLLSSTKYFILNKSKINIEGYDIYLFEKNTSFNKICSSKI